MSMKIRLFVTLSALTALGTLTQAAPPVQPVAAPTAAAPKLGDADFPKPSPGGRHDEKVAAVKAGNFQLAMIGDSITECVGDAGGEWEPLKAVWAKHYAPRHAINLGYSGYRTENILWNLQHGELDFASSPKVFTLLIGTNNTDDQHYPSIHTGEQVFAGTKAIVDLIKQRHPTAKILIQAILPSGGPTDRTDYNRKYNRSPKGLAAYRRAHPTKLERTVMAWLDEHYYSYEREVRIAGIYCDFLISKTRIIIEVDGHMAHTMHPLHGQDRASRDLIHGMAIATAGYTLIRLDESDIKNNTYPGKLAGL